MCHVLTLRMSYVPEGGQLVVLLRLPPATRSSLLSSAKKKRAKAPRNYRLGGKFYMALNRSD